jgi:hypothetical protein
MAITPTSASAGDRARLWRPIVLGEPLGRGVRAHVAPLSLDSGHHSVTAHQPVPSLATASPSSSTASISCSRTTVLTIVDAHAPQFGRAFERETIFQRQKDGERATDAKRQAQRLAAQRTARSAMMDSTLNPRPARYPRRAARLRFQWLIVPPPLCRT